MEPRQKRPRRQHELATAVAPHVDDSGAAANVSSAPSLSQQCVDVHWTLRDLQIYSSPPVTELRLEVVEEVLQHRLELLKQASCCASADDFATGLADASLLPFGRPVFDECGHALARLVCATDRRTARWFVDAETRLFRWRMSVARPQEILHVLCRLQVDAQFVTGSGADQHISPPGGKEALHYSGKIGTLPPCCRRPECKAPCILWNPQALPGGYFQARRLTCLQAHVSVRAST